MCNKVNDDLETIVCEKIVNNEEEDKIVDGKAQDETLLCNKDQMGNQDQENSLLYKEEHLVNQISCHIMFDLRYQWGWA